MVFLENKAGVAFTFFSKRWCIRSSTGARCEMEAFGDLEEELGVRNGFADPAGFLGAVKEKGPTAKRTKCTKRWWLHILFG